jgi:hypothetical protein
MRIANNLTDFNLQLVGHEVAALLIIKAMTEPGTDIEDQVSKSIAKKFRVTDRPRPHVIQLYTAFGKVMHHKRAKGDKRPDTTMLALCIKEFNGKQTAKNRVSVEEREAILTLHSQTDNFRKMLAHHWQNYPVAYSAVPVSLLAKSWLCDVYEPPVKKLAFPRTHAALQGNQEKRETWLMRVIGKYLKGLKDMRATGKSVNIRNVGMVLRRETDDEMVRHCACMLTTWLPMFRGVLSAISFDELLQRFYRGGLDRELTEKVKSADEALGVHDWRFLATLHDYSAPSGGQPGDMSKAQSDMMEADLMLVNAMLRNEGKQWSGYLSQLRLFNAETHNDKVAEQEATTHHTSTLQCGAPSSTTQNFSSKARRVFLFCRRH